MWSEMVNLYTKLIKRSIIKSYYRMNWSLPVAEFFLQNLARKHPLNLDYLEKELGVPYFSLHIVFTQ